MKDELENILDESWYINRYQDVSLSGFSPLEHYERIGKHLGREINGNHYSQKKSAENTKNKSKSGNIFCSVEKQDSINFDAYLRKKASTQEYQQWIKFNEPSEDELLNQRKIQKNFTHRPIISIILPVYKLPLRFLQATINSLESQTYSKWEACIAFADKNGHENLRYLQEKELNDHRFKIVKINSNLGISGNSNIALQIATGEFVALLDHDDELTPFAFFQMVDAINRNPTVDFLYSDKDQIDEDGIIRQSPLFKPEWSPETMYSVNYLTHFNIIRRDLVNRIGGFRSSTDGAQDWDIFLRVCEQARKIIRVPGVHYHWRIHPASTSTGISSKPYALNGQEVSIRDHLARTNTDADVIASDDSGFKIIWKLPNKIKVSIIIDLVLNQQNTSNKNERLDKIFHYLVEELDNNTNIDAIIVVVSESKNQFENILLNKNISDRLEIRCILATSENKGEEISNYLENIIEFNNAVVFLSGLIESLSPGWLVELLGWVICSKDVGFATALVLDTNQLVVEAGAVVDEFGHASSMFRGSPLRHWGILGGPLWYRNCRAFHPWAAAVNVNDYITNGGLKVNSSFYSSFIALCVDIYNSGKRGIVNPHCRAMLGEGDLPALPEFSVSLKNDPYFHPAFSCVSPLKLDIQNNKPPKEANKESNNNISEAMALASVIGCSSNDLQEQQQHPERVGKGEGAGWFNWYLPGFSNPYYGGVMTILRFADFMHREHGIRQRFLICGHENAERIKTSLTSAFPSLEDCEVLILDSGEAISQIPASDYSSATLWTTAYVLLRIKNAGLKFYFVQDCEPLFYPAGSTYAQAEMTYRFGFYGICNTETLHGMYEREYGGKATYFKPQVDPTVFHGSIARPESGPKRIFFYGRPGHARNGFELTILGMKTLKERLGDHVEIICAGAEWDPEDFGLQGVVTNLGLLGYQETGELYRSCHIGFVMMMTKHPSYLPFELMACGALLVSNVNSSNAWLLKDGENCLLAQPSAVTIADRLEYAVRHYNQLENIRKTGRDLIEKEHSDWCHAFDGVWEFIKNL